MLISIAQYQEPSAACGVVFWEDTLPTGRDAVSENGESSRQLSVQPEHGLVGHRLSRPQVLEVRPLKRWQFLSLGPDKNFC